MSERPVSESPLPALRRPEVAFPLILAPGLVVVAIVGQVEYDLFTDYSIVGAAFLLSVFTVPFLPIAFALLDGLIGEIAALAAFAAGTAALVVIPWLVDTSIRGDDSSTAGLVHIWDPC